MRLPKTAKNVFYSSPAKRPGGSGRSEIDLLATKIAGDEIDRVRAEVGVGVTSTFPRLSRKSPGTDEARKLLRKFFSRGTDLNQGSISVAVTTGTSS